jgi:hypothetical protein
MMSFTRYMLANWRIAFVPKIGTAYREANVGPFEIGPVATPKQLKRGHVLYELVHPNGYAHEMAVSFGVFASMYREA